MIKFSSITIAIPAYNEEATIEWVVKNCLKDLPKYFKSYEVLIIDDGSKDGTKDIADKLSKRSKFVRVIHQPNKGYSKAMAIGIFNARKEFVAFVPADGQYYVRDMTKMFPLLETSDIVLGYRGKRLDYNLYRKILSYGYLILLLVLFGITVKDLNGSTIWRTEEVKKLKRLYSVNSKGVFILAEIVARFKRKGLKISEAPTIYRPRMGGVVKNTKFKVVKDTLIDAIKLWWKMFINNQTD